MIEYLTHGTEEGTTNYDTSSHPGGDVQVTSVVFAEGGCRYLAQWWVSIWLRGGWVDEMGMENSLD